MATPPIALGQRFRDVRVGLFGRQSSIWIVDELFVGRDHIDYARLVCASDPSERKTLSLAVLRDPRRFVIVEK